jgi:alkanesulfonate monooxygenase SsuD/methylene tetrahydromethanopterin reductase-like flavin-dependent oxidoreductase (luciferase family)
MSAKKPALALTPVPNRRRAVVEAVQKMEEKGYAGLYCPSTLGGMSLVEALAWQTNSIPFGVTVAPIYSRVAEDFAETAASLNEVSGGRFRLGVGVSHGPTQVKFRAAVGKPIGDMREFVERYKAATGAGESAPLTLAGMRPRMIKLAGEVGDGLVFANAALTKAKESLALLPQEKLDDPDFFIGNMMPTCISDDIEAAKAVHKRTLSRYVLLPYYRSYWREAGYAEEMAEIDALIESGDTASISDRLSDKWLDDITLFGSASRVRERVEMWRETGVKTPILVPSSANGNQMKAVEEIFEAFD